MKCQYLYCEFLVNQFNAKCSKKYTLSSKCQEYKKNIISMNCKNYGFTIKNDNNIDPILFFIVL